MLAAHDVLSGDLLGMLNRLALRLPLDIFGDLPHLIIVAGQHEARQILRRNRRRDRTIVSRSACARLLAFGALHVVNVAEPVRRAT